MSKRKHHKIKKGQSDINSQTEDQDDIKDYKRIRIVQKNLVFVTGLTEEMCSRQILQSTMYFGRYGKVIKSVINKNQLYTTKNHKNHICSAYITYQNQLQASLAIIALDDYQLEDRVLKVSYGNTKYCTFFTKNLDCPNIKDCYFLHEWDVSEEHTKQQFALQLKSALQIVMRGLTLIINKIKQTKQHSIFPSIQTALHILVDKEYLTLHRYNQLVSKDNRSFVSEESLGQSQRKITKSNSLSTMCSPQTLIDSNFTLLNDSFQDYLQKQVTKNLLNQSSHSRSKLYFASQDPPSDDSEKIKKYVQKYLLLKRIW